MSALVTALGWVGAVTCLVAYVFVTRGHWAPTSGRYQLANVVSGLLMGLVAANSGVWPSVATNAVWAVVGAHAVAVVLRARRRRAQEAADTAASAGPTPAVHTEDATATPVTDTRTATPDVAHTRTATPADAGTRTATPPAAGTRTARPAAAEHARTATPADAGTTTVALAPTAAPFAAMPTAEPVAAAPTAASVTADTDPGAAAVIAAGTQATRDAEAVITAATAVVTAASIASTAPACAALSTDPSSAELPLQRTVSASTVELAV